MSRKKNGVPWRKNVLVLVGMGYAMVLIVFVFLVWKGGKEAADAYKFVEAALMALVGGSLALSKDLVDDVVSGTSDENSENGD